MGACSAEGCGPQSTRNPHVATFVLDGTEHYNRFSDDAEGFRGGRSEMNTFFRDYQPCHENSSQERVESFCVRVLESLDEYIPS